MKNHTVSMSLSLLFLMYLKVWLDFVCCLVSNLEICIFATGIVLVLSTNFILKVCVIVITVTGGRYDVLKKHLRKRFKYRSLVIRRCKHFVVLASPKLYRRGWPDLWFFWERGECPNLATPTAACSFLLQEITQV